MRCKTGISVYYNIFFSGKGIFAATDFKKGEFLLEYRRDLLSYSVAKKKESEYGDKYGSFMFYFKYKEMSLW